MVQDQTPNQDRLDSAQAEDKILANLSLVTNKNSPENFSLTPVNPEKKEIYLIIRSLKNKDGTQKVFFFVLLFVCIIFYRFILYPKYINEQIIRKIHII